MTRLALAGKCGEARTPSPAAACIAAGIRVQVNQTLASVAGNIPALSVAEIAETMLACVGINLDIG